MGKAKLYFDGSPCKRGHADGRYVSSGACVQCARDAHLERWLAYYSANREEHKAASREWYATNKERAQRTMARWRKENPEAVKHTVAKAKIKYRAKNKDKIRAYQKKWNAENRERRAAHERNRIARKLAAEGSHTHDDILSIYDRQSGICLCGTDLSVGYHVDHIEPLSRGGSNGPDNLQLLCPPCNMSKHDKTMDEWRKALSLRVA